MASIPPNFVIYTIMGKRVYGYAGNYVIGERDHWLHWYDEVVSELKPDVSIRSAIRWLK